jgi:hypothetical protein
MTRNRIVHAWRSAEYEAKEHAVVESRLSPKSIVLGDNSHVTNPMSQTSFLNFPPELDGSSCSSRNSPKITGTPARELESPFAVDVGHSTM